MSNVSDSTAVAVNNLTVTYATKRQSEQPVIQDITFTIRKGERVGLIGDSGAGKSTLARTLCGINRKARVLNGSVDYPEWRRGRTAHEAHMHNGQSFNVGYIFQNPYGCLNPSMSIAQTMREQLHILHHTQQHLWLKTHSRAYRTRYAQEISDILKQLRFAHPAHVLSCRPHQLSRGMCQRIAIALNMIIRPRLLICDEPTSALDHDAERHVRDILCTTSIASALLFITHNIQLALAICTRILVLENGTIVDDVSVADVQKETEYHKRASATREYIAIARRMAPPPPQQSHTRTTHASASPHVADTPAAAAEKETARAHIIRLQNICFAYRLRTLYGITKRGEDVLHNLSLTISARESVGIIGKSGSGKSTLLGVLSALLRPQSGEYLFAGEPLFHAHSPNPATLALLRRNVQFIPQNPSDSLPPRMPIAHIIAEPLRLQAQFQRRRRQRQAERTRIGAAEIQQRLRAAADEAQLAPSLLNRYPHELSIGQQQRALIARALIINPTLLLADEPFSALDSRVKGKIIDLLQELQQRRHISLCVVSHHPEDMHALTTHHYHLQRRALERV